MRISYWSSDVCSSDLRAASHAASTNVTNGKRNRDAFLTAIDGIMYGDDPKHGVVQGRTFVHPVFRLAFTVPERSEEHTSELQSLMRISYAVFCLKKKKNQYNVKRNLRTKDVQ